MNTPQQPEPTQTAPLPETTSIGGFVAGPLQTNCYVLADTSRLTAEGKAAVDGAFEALLDAEARLLADLPDRDRARLGALLRTLLAPFS